MRIGVDARGVFTPDPRGHVKSVFSLYRRLPALEPSWEFFMYCYPGGPPLEAAFGAHKNMHKRELDPRGSRLFDYQSLWKNVALPFALLRDRIDILHGPCGPLPFYNPKKGLVTIHDVIPYQGVYSPVDRAAARELRRSAESAARIITISEFSRKEIAAMFGPAVGNKITVIKLAGSEMFDGAAPESKGDDVPARYGVQPPYVLNFAHNRHPRKNTERTIEAFARAVKVLEHPLQLFITGVPDPAAKAYYQGFAHSHGVGDRLTIYGYVPEEDLPALLKHADCLLYASLAEGFGLPPLDAMACECPVIASNSSSIPEVLGDAAYFVDPADAAEIAAAIVELRSNRELRQTLIERGRLQAGRYSWDAAAVQTRDLFKEIYR